MPKNDFNKGRSPVGFLNVIRTAFLTNTFGGLFLKTQKSSFFFFFSVKNESLPFQEKFRTHPPAIALVVYLLETFEIILFLSHDICTVD